MSSFFSNFKKIFRLNGSSDENSKRKKHINPNISYYINPSLSWDIIGELGDGAFGQVYKAKNKDNDLLAALKQVEIKGEDELEDFSVEIDILSECKHKNIVGLHEAFYYAEKLWMYIEFCEGGALDSIMVELEKGLTEEQIRYVTHEMCEGLEFLHSHNIIHRDLKAGNVLVTTDGGIKLADFGVSARNTKNRQTRDTFIGTPYWMAPEVIMCETLKDTPYNFKADIWSLGVTMIEFAQVEPPNHDIPPMRVLIRIQKSEPPNFDKPSKWSADFRNIVSRCCLIKDPEKRPTATELLKHPFIHDFTNRKSLVNLLCEARAEVIEIVDDLSEDEELKKIKDDLSVDSQSVDLDMSPSRLESEADVQGADVTNVTVILSEVRQESLDDVFPNQDASLELKQSKGDANLAEEDLPIMPHPVSGTPAEVPIIDSDNKTDMSGQTITKIITEVTEKHNNERIIITDTDTMEEDVKETVCKDGKVASSESNEDTVEDVSEVITEADLESMSECKGTIPEVDKTALELDKRMYPEGGDGTIYEANDETVVNDTMAAMKGTILEAVGKETIPETDSKSKVTTPESDKETSAEVLESRTEGEHEKSNVEISRDALSEISVEGNKDEMASGTESFEREIREKVELIDTEVPQDTSSPSCRISEKLTVTSEVSDIVSLHGNGQLPEENGHRAEIPVDDSMPKEMPKEEMNAVESLPQSTHDVLKNAEGNIVGSDDLTVDELTDAVKIANEEEMTNAHDDTMIDLPHSDNENTSTENIESVEHAAPTELPKCVEVKANGFHSNGDDAIINAITTAMNDVNGDTSSLHEVEEKGESSGVMIVSNQETIDEHILAMPSDIPSSLDQEEQVSSSDDVAADMMENITLEIPEKTEDVPVHKQVTPDVICDDGFVLLDPKRFSDLPIKDLTSLRESSTDTKEPPSDVLSHVSDDLSLPAEVTDSSRQTLDETTSVADEVTRNDEMTSAADEDTRNDEMTSVHDEDTRNDETNSHVVDFIPSVPDTEMRESETPEPTSCIIDSKPCVNDDETSAVCETEDASNDSEDEVNHEDNRLDVSNPDDDLEQQSDMVASSKAVADRGKTGKSYSSGEGAQKRPYTQKDAGQYRTIKKTRRFVIDGVVVTSTTSKVVQAGAENRYREEHDHRKKDLRELKMLQKLENKQYQELEEKAQLATTQQNERLHLELTNLTRQFDNDLELLTRKQRQLVERAEMSLTADIKYARKKDLSRTG